ncbi:hypothetical protein [Pseudoduganella lutea]|uniref:Uncharacterized protein n=1 Tax=Pseudoduganella lutea TaxID=321985 RepID=A0A4P6KZM0_9BURK|nr:hypothetical protein [Pseudoduganella lutea]QBE64062.1 hypothetical protein EWM63_14620 [Pseudoduganella lutea]
MREEQCSHFTLKSKQILALSSGAASVKAGTQLAAGKMDVAGLNGNAWGVNAETAASCPAGADRHW